MSNGRDEKDAVLEKQNLIGGNKSKDVSVIKLVNHILSDVINAGNQGITPHNRQKKISHTFMLVS